MESAVTEEVVLRALRQVMDPEMGVNVVDLGLVDSLAIDVSHVSVSLGMTSPACPVSPLICRNAKEAILTIGGVETAEVTIADDFKWSPDKMSAFARMQLGTASVGDQGITPIQSVDPLSTSPNTHVTAWHRLPLLAIGMISLAVGIWAGLVRLGWDWDLARWNWIVVHGPLMVCGFLGTVIGLERAVGLGQKWAYGAPVMAVLGAVTLLVAEFQALSAILMILASLILVAIFLAILKKHNDLANQTMLLGAVCWLVSNILWLFHSIIFLLTPWWIAFLVLTIAGERIELTRFLEPTKKVLAGFVGCVIIMIIGCLVSLKSYIFGAQIQSLGLLALAAWLWIFDIARRTVRQTGLTRFTASCLLVGYVWMALAGVLGLSLENPGGGIIYDSFLHMLFIGFVFSMIFGHAPIIFPSVLNRPLNYHPIFYLHLILIHAGLILRVIGNLGDFWEIRLWGGLLSGVAIVLFALNTVRSILFQPKRA